MSQSPQSSTDNRRPAQIQADLEVTRRELGETVDALGAKLDVKGRAQQRASTVWAETRRRVAALRRDRAREVAIVAGLVGAGIVIVIARQRR